MILQEGLRKGDPRAPIAQNSLLGWIVSGGCDEATGSSGRRSFQCSVENELEALVRRFWDQEKEVPAPATLTSDEQRCEDIFVTTHRRDAEGRYVVRLPFASLPTTLAGTRIPAELLLAAMERRFKREPHFGKLYHEFLKEYEELGHMRLSEDRSTDGTRRCYLPHHGVLRESSSSTKLRVVFNGSQRSTAGDSLNDHLLTGANLLPPLSDILMRWRWHRYALCSDIEKMYRQILVDQQDQEFQLILWRHHSTDAIHEFQLRTVTYGLACAPFLAIRTLRQLADDEGHHYPRGAAALRCDCYVDDIVTGAHSISDATALQHDLRQLCMAGGFSLRKWAANCRDVLQGIPSDHWALQEPVSWEDDSHTTLGLRWYPAEDKFAFKIQQKITEDFTKRRVLAETARIFDPLGWLTPVTIRAKILIQSAWLQGLEWDAPLPADSQQWKLLFFEFPQLESLRIDRWLGTGSAESSLELHGFADASERGYAAVLHLRITTNHDVRTQLLVAKSKVTPVKPISLPRLELCAAALVTNLAVHTRSVLGLSSTPVTLWSDSTVALHWIRGHASRWTTYVANRVSHIQSSLPEARWRHIPGKDNPADCASRGISPSDLLDHPL